MSKNDRNARQSKRKNGISKQCREGCPAGAAVVEQYIKYFAAGIVNVINIFQPEILVIGGGVSKEGDYLISPLKKIVEREVYSRDVEQTQIRIAQLGNDAGIIGASVLGLQVD